MLLHRWLEQEHRAIFGRSRHDGPDLAHLVDGDLNRLVVRQSSAAHTHRVLRQANDPDTHLTIPLDVYDGPLGLVIEMALARGKLDADDDGYCKHEEVVEGPEEDDEFAVSGIPEGEAIGKDTEQREPEQDGEGGKQAPLH